jgi:hypothetical protein
VPAPAAEATRAPVSELAAPTPRPRAVSIGGDPAAEYAPTNSPPVVAPAAPVAEPIAVAPEATVAPAPDQSTATAEQPAQPLSGVWLAIAAAASLGVIAIVSGIGMALLAVKRRRE